MDFFCFCVGYLLLTIGLIGVLLFGESPMFIGTPIAWFHWLITAGACDGIQCVVRRTCGRRGMEGLERVLTYCCDKPNPVMQIAYVSLLSVGFFMYMLHVFPLLPGNPRTATYHMFTGTACVSLCLVLFVVASLSDPGIVTPANAASHHALYRMDGQIWTAKECRTCLFQRPARSKHCSVCSACVARHDHHCGWINNCVGLLNLRYFLAFLAANAGVCFYGATVGVLTLLGDMERRGLFSARRMDWDLGEAVPLLHGPSRIAQWLVVVHPIPLALVMFLALIGLLLAGFLAYQMQLLGQGRTQYEAYRWRDLRLQRTAEAVADALVGPATRGAAAGEDLVGGGGAGAAGVGVSVAAGAGGSETGPAAAREAGGAAAAAAQKPGGWLRWRSQAPAVVIEAPVNVYDRGFWQGLYEITFPERCLQAALHKQR